MILLLEHDNQSEPNRILTTFYWQVQEHIRIQQACVQNEDIDKKKDLHRGARIYALAFVFSNLVLILIFLHL